MDRAIRFAAAMCSRNKFSRRLRIVAAICLTGAAGIFGRMAFLTIVRGDQLLEAGLREKCRESVYMAYRGPIVDRNGVVLATTVSASMVSRERPYSYDSSHAVALAPLLGQDRAQLDERLRQGGDAFLWLSNSVDDDTATAIRNLAIPGVGLHISQQRSYPQGMTAAHVIGFAGRDSKGLEGIERLFDTEIGGEAVTARVCRDIRGGILLNTAEDMGTNRGASVHLTLDAKLQGIAEAELNRQVAENSAGAGAVVMMDPKTGEILALANSPTFDPYDVDASPTAARRNRSVTDLFEPASTMKPLVIAAAMDAGIIQVDDKFFCENGKYEVEGWPRPIRDQYPYGWLSIADVMRVSSNICSAKIGILVGPRLLYDYLSAFGFDRLSGIEMPGERKGLVLPPEKWRDINTATISFGQGIGVTALQLASAYATIANDGVRMQPRMVRKITDQRGSIVKYFPPEEERRVVSAEIARKMRQMMAAIVTKEGSTALARIDGVPAAGKSGTAQKAENGSYSADHWLASFAGFFPVEAPRAVIVIMIDDPKGAVHFGGLVAAPLFGAIAEQSLDYLGIEHGLSASASELDRQFETNAGDEPPQADANSESVVPAGDSKMPDVRGMPLRSAIRVLADCGCEVRVQGHGLVVSSEPSAGATFSPSGSVFLRLSGKL